MHFRGVLGKDICDTVDSISGSNSWCNHEEAHAVVDIICKICFEGRASTEDIGVMAPYRSQVVLIRKLLRGKNLGGVNVGTVEDYQGVEKNIIVLSLTRSNLAFVNEDFKQRMGLFQQPMRMNVALTRAENMFVVVGNPHLMATDRLWKQWLCFCHRNGLWYGEGLDAKEMYHLYGKSRRHITCHVLRKLPPTGLYPNDKEVSESQIQEKGPSNHLKYILMSSIERRVRLLQLTSRMD
jgi:superfamily I DNA and/or RNA helicase